MSLNHSGPKPACNSLSRHQVPSTLHILHSWLGLPEILPNVVCTMLADGFTSFLDLTQPRSRGEILRISPRAVQRTFVNLNRYTWSPSALQPLGSFCWRRAGSDDRQSLTDGVDTRRIRGNAAVNKDTDGTTWRHAVSLDLVTSCKTAQTLNHNSKLQKHHSKIAGLDDDGS